MWLPIGHMGYKWPARSVEPLPPFRLRKLRNQILLMSTTADPATPLANAKFVAELLADQAVLVEQLGFGHTTLAEYSRCTKKIVTDYIMHGIVGHLSLLSDEFAKSWGDFQLPRQNETKCKVDNPFGPLTSLFSLEDQDTVPRFVVQHP